MVLPMMWTADDVQLFVLFVLHTQQQQQQLFAPVSFDCCTLLATKTKAPTVQGRGGGRACLLTPDFGLRQGR